MEDEEYDEEEEGCYDQNDYNNKKKKVPNSLTPYGNERTMNLNSLVLTNIQNSIYFKYNLYDINTYHGVLEEISKKVKHLEPWEKGSRKTAGQTGMCGGVRGVGAGGVVSSAYCLLYKLFTLKLTRNQVFGMLNYHNTYVRGLGFLFIRYTQHPQKFWEWFEPYLDDDEEIDPKAGSGRPMTIGNMCMMLMTRLDWFTTLFPRIPVVMMKELEAHMTQRNAELGIGPEQGEYNQRDQGPNRREGSYNNQREGSSGRYNSPSQEGAYNGREQGRGNRGRVDQVRGGDRGPYSNNNSREGSYRDSREGSQREREGSMSQRSPPGSSQEEKEAKTEEEAPAEAPRIIRRHVPEKKEKKKKKKKKGSGSDESGEEGEAKDEGKIKDLSIEEGEKTKDKKRQSRSPSKDRRGDKGSDRKRRSRSRDRKRSRSKDRKRSTSRSKDRRRSRSKERNVDKHRDRKRSRSRERKRSTSRDRERKRDIKERRSRSKERSKSRRSASPEKKREKSPDKKRDKTPEKRMIKRYNQ